MTMEDVDEANPAIDSRASSFAVNFRRREKSVTRESPVGRTAVAARRDFCRGYTAKVINNSPLRGCKEAAGAGRASAKN